MNESNSLGAETVSVSAGFGVQVWVTAAREEESVVLVVLNAPSESR